MKQYRYKLTNQNMQTHAGTQWQIGEWKKASGIGALCTNGWLHCYNDPLLAVLHNPIHADINKALMRLWLVEVSGEYLRDGDMKEGWSNMRLIDEMDIPDITSVQIIAYGILCALEVYEDSGFKAWAGKWLSGEDRSGGAARTAAETAAKAATKAAAEAAEAAKAAAWAAWAVAEAAWAVAEAAAEAARAAAEAAAEDARAAEAAADTAEAAAEAAAEDARAAEAAADTAEAAAEAAAWAAWAAKDHINLTLLVSKAMMVK